jgi:hypothetical protein
VLTIRCVRTSIGDVSTSVQDVSTSVQDVSTSVFRVECCGGEKGDGLLGVLEGLPAIYTAETVRRRLFVRSISDRRVQGLR